MARTHALTAFGRGLSLLVSTLVVILLASWVPTAEASALTTTIPANERTCFYANVDKAGEKVCTDVGRRCHKCWLTLAAVASLATGRLLLCRKLALRAHSAFDQTHANFVIHF